MRAHNVPFQYDSGRFCPPVQRFYANVYHPIAKRVSGAARKLKQRNKPLCRVLQYGIGIGLLYLIFA